MGKSGFRSIWVIGVLAVVLFAWMANESFARVGSGGRSFGGSGRSFSSPSSPPLRSVPPPPPGGGMGGSGFGRSMPGAGGTGSSFLRGVGGGLLGGMIGGMLFGRPSYGYGAGGFGGSGIGLIELLLLAGLGYFLYKRFIKNPSGGGRPASPASGWENVMGSPGPPPVPGSGYGNEMTSADPVAETFRTIRQTEPDFDPERFKEIAQDVFFRIQAAWMRRDLTPVLGLIGDQLKSEYLATMAELKQKGHINKLENIAVRRIEIVDAGVQGNEVYITLLFTANLLDYTVAESSGEIVSGSNTEPVKFEERWTFARPLNGTSWKLEAVSS